ncbi:MAG: hypothetical protein RIS76_2611 [Verrucomicrobiota bacterium]|jgi:hypothetical protein
MRILLSPDGTADGTFNCTNNFIPAGASEKALILDPDGAPLSRSVGRVEVIGSDSSILSSTKDGTGNPLGADGIFALGVMSVPGGRLGGSGRVTLRVWDSSTGASYDEASVRGQTSISLPSLDGGMKPPDNLSDSDFRGLRLSGGIG